MKITTKVIATISKEELESTKNNFQFDPCEEIMCCAIDCKDCPLRESVTALNEAKRNFLNDLCKLSVTED